MVQQTLDAFNRLPLPAKLGGALITVGSMFAAVMIFRGPALWVLIAGLGVVGIALLIYRLVLKAQEKRKESPMYKALLGNAAAAPMTVSEPARRARLDDLRKNFEGGMEKFRAAGKSVYAVPWYVMVGEPGSGKTEMIRHSNIGFPPGLQDQLQGAGGTLNMHWWFSNNAVILDTAGRLMFEEVEPGTTSEWEEMLKQLRRNRPNCPINGMLLVIPAESLVRDTPEAIERKGGRIAQQLDSIQRTLGVRFPVFIIITKCDLINGFREFFDEINDPQLQHQMLGWSNPNDLDTPFNPEMVEEHLKTVQQRLMRRRLGLLLDPINTDDPKARRTDQVDALYAFPDSMMKIGPRLKRYLEMIFVAGEWSQKPLFLRGIYFNSAMREGAALDAELAEALGVPLESLPEGRVWTRDRSFFIRDVMIGKVFRERGLVTRATNTSKLRRRRRNILIGTAGGGLLLLGLFTWLGDRSLKQRIIPAANFWRDVSRAYVGSMEDGKLKASPNLAEPDRRLGTTETTFYPVVSRRREDDQTWTYHGREGGNDGEALAKFDVPLDHKSVAKFPLALKRGATDSVSVPLGFRWLSPTEGNLLAEERAEAARRLVEGSILRPLINAAETRLELENDAPWSGEATGALAQLVKLEMTPLPGAKPGIVDTDLLLQYALKDNAEGAKAAKEDAADLQGAVAWFYSSESGGTWPPATLVRSRASLIDGATKRFESAWKSPDRAPAGAAGYTKVQALIAALKDFGTKEGELFKLREQAGVREGDTSAFLSQWKMRYEEVKAAAKRVEDNIGVLRDPEKGTDRTLAQAFESELALFRKEAQRQHALLLDVLKPLAPAGDKPSEMLKAAEGTKERDRAERLAELRKTLDKSLTETSQETKVVVEARQDAGRLDALHLASVAEPLFRQRQLMYDLANSRIAEAAPASDQPPGMAHDRLVGIREQIASDGRELDARVRIRSGAEAAGANDLQSGARSLSVAVIELAAARRRAEIIDRFLKQAPAEKDRIAELVKGITASKGGLARPEVPLTVAPRVFDERYTPAAAAAVLGDYYAVRRSLAPASQAPAGSSASGGVVNAPALAPKFAPLGEGAAAYLREYVGYWTRGVLDADSSIGVPGGWREFINAVQQTGRAPAVNRALGNLVKEAQAAADLVDKAVERDSLGPDDRTEVERLVRSAERAKATLENEKFRNDAESVVNRWDKLATDAEGARTQVLNAWTSGRIREYVLVPEPGDAGDLARRHWQRYSHRVIALLAAEGGGATARAVQRLLGLGFPLGAPGREMSPADLPEALRAYEATKSAIVSAGAPGVAPAASSGDAQIDADLNRMRGEDAVSAADERTLRRVGSMLEVLKGKDLTCTLTLVKKPGTFDLLPEIGISRNGAMPDRWATIYESGRDALGSIATPSAGNELLAVDVTGNPTQRAPIPIPGQWGALGMMAAPGARPQSVNGSRRVFDVEVPVEYQGKTFPLWVRLDFSRDLPDGWPYSGQ